MKKLYEEPQTEIIHYQDEDIILTSSHHHCGEGILTGHEYVDSTGDSYCDTDENYHCDGGSGDYVHGEDCDTDCEYYDEEDEGT